MFLKNTPLPLPTALSILEPRFGRKSLNWSANRAHCVSARFTALFMIPSNHSGKLFQTVRSEEHTSELQSLMRISYAVFCLKKKTSQKNNKSTTTQHKKI